jgi:hypothetical protein
VIGNLFEKDDPVVSECRQLLEKESGREHPIPWAGSQQKADWDPHSNERSAGEMAIVDVSGMQLNYVEWASGNETVVFIHGKPRSRELTTVDELP